MTIPSSRSLIFELKSTGNEHVFICVLRLGLGNADFGRLRKTSDVFLRLRTSSGIFGNDQVVFKNPSTPRIKILTPISQKKLAGIKYSDLTWKLLAFCWGEVVAYERWLKPEDRWYAVSSWISNLRKQLAIICANRDVAPLSQTHLSCPM